MAGALAPTTEKHLASITDPQEVGALRRAIDAYEGSLFVRPGELRAAQWSEFDFEKAEWRIPAERMKMRVQHIVPLSRQAIAVLSNLQQLTGRFALAFPGMRSRFRPMSENTIAAALRWMGYNGQDMTSHGFRSMASTLLNEQGWNRDVPRQARIRGVREPAH